MNADRYRLRDLCLFVVIFLRAEAAVAGVAEAGDDVAFVVEVGVDAGGVDGDVGVFGVDGEDAFGGGDEADEFQAGDAALFEEVDGGDGGASGGEHGVEDQQEGVGGEGGGDLDVVLDGLEGFFIAEEADVTDLGVGEGGDGALDHGESGAEDGGEDDFFFIDALGHHGGEGGVDGHLGDGEIARGLVAEVARELGDTGAEFLRRGFLAAKFAEGLADERVVADMEEFGGGGHGGAFFGCGGMCGGSAGGGWDVHGFGKLKTQNSKRKTTAWRCGVVAEVGLYFWRCGCDLIDGGVGDADG